MTDRLLKADIKPSNISTTWKKQKNKKQPIRDPIEQILQKQSPQSQHVTDYWKLKPVLEPHLNTGVKESKSNRQFIMRFVF